MAGTKADLIELITKGHDFPPPVAQAVLEAFLEVFIENLVTQGRLELREFGTFEVRERAARLGHNPRTGRSVDIPKTRRVAFKMGRKMRERFGVGVRKGLRVTDGSNP